MGLIKISKESLDAFKNGERQKKIILCHCIDNFGKNYHFAIICDENKVEQTIKEYESTEIIDFEILDAYQQEQ